MVAHSGKALFTQGSEIMSKFIGEPGMERRLEQLQSARPLPQRPTTHLPTMPALFAGITPTRLVIEGDFLINKNQPALFDEQRGLLLELRSTRSRTRGRHVHFGSFANISGPCIDVRKESGTSNCAARMSQKFQVFLTMSVPTVVSQK